MNHSIVKHGPLNHYTNSILKVWYYTNNFLFTYQETRTRIILLFLCYLVFLQLFTYQKTLQVFHFGNQQINKLACTLVLCA
jgi:hypothetical protein